MAKSAKQNLAQAQNQMGALQDQAWDYNVNQPWQTKMTIANEKRQAGAQNLFGGMGDMASSVMNFAGTSNFMDIYKKLFPQVGTGMSDDAYSQFIMGNARKQSVVNPQNNLNNTLSGMAQNIKINYPQ